MTRSVGEIMDKMELGGPHPMAHTTGLFLNDKLVAALEADGVDPDEYRPAYDGESVGLDLYNAGPEFVVPSAQNALDYLDLYSELRMQNIRTWLDMPEGLRKGVYKRFMPTGLKTVIPRGYVGLIQERSSITKSPAKVRAGVIDPGYTGEIFVNMVNVSPVRYTIPTGAKSPFQLVIVPANVAYKRLTAEEFQALHERSSRGTGKIGSTDK